MCCVSCSRCCHQVAVKVVQIGSHTELLNFLRELEALANLRHPNVVPFCAAVLEVGGRNPGPLLQWLETACGGLPGACSALAVGFCREFPCAHGLRGQHIAFCPSLVEGSWLVRQEVEGPRVVLLCGEVGCIP